MPQYYQYIKLSIRFHADPNTEVVGYQEIRNGSLNRITDENGTSIDSSITGPYDSTIIDIQPELPSWVVAIPDPVVEEPPPEDPPIDSSGNDLTG